MALDTRYSVITTKGITGEKLLVWIWQHQHLKPGLATTEGESLRVIFPGRRNGLGGPDFRRAILDTHRGQFRGDVELHLRSSLWRDHGHQRDPAYNSVVLHVVMWHDCLTPICLNNGKQVPTLALAPFVLRQGQRGKPSAREPCRQPGRWQEALPLERFLEAQGEARFTDRVVRFRDRLVKEDPAQVLYEGIMEALGYSRNQAAFKELARRLPLKEAEAVVRDEGREAVYNLLLERGGLGLPFPASRLLPHEMGSEMRETSASPPPREEIHWQRQGVRPVNQPARRLLAISHLLERYNTTGLLAGLMAAVERAAQGGGQTAPIYRRPEIHAALMVGATDESMIVDKGRCRPALLGRERAGEIAVNILLPFACASGLESQAIGLYRGYAPLPENEITREMSELLGIEKKPANSACRQQGLIHLFKLFCGERQCHICPLGTTKSQIPSAKFQ